MARITLVAAAQQRYKTVPVIDPETGRQRETPVMVTRGGVKEQKKTKSGKPVFRKQTIEDRDQPLPLEVCESCQLPIAVGDPYKHVTPKTSAYGGRKRSRHAACPGWMPWDLSDSLSAQIDRVRFEATEESGGWEDKDAVESALSSAAEAIRELADSKQEAASNMEEGFGHPTSATEQLAEQAESLTSWADEVEGTDVPELPEPEEGECDECGGTGKAEVAVDGSDVPNEADCEQCDGTGRLTPDAPTDEQMEQWRTDAVEAVETALESSPV